jgi:DNA-binding NarL/FixJ family response regulator
MIRVLIFEDDPDLTDSLVEIIGDAPDMTVVGTFAHAQHAAREVKRLQPDVVLSDIDMPGGNGLQGLRAIREQNTKVCILMLTVFDDNENVFQAICDGANGYLLKSTPPEKLLDAIREAHDGGAPMTPSIARQVLRLFAEPYKEKRSMGQLTAREHDVLTLLVRGFSYKMIAAELHLSPETVHTHIKNIYSKLHVNSKSEAVAKALHNKIV